MAEVSSIDQSKLPGVKEVCRDFAVLEDHTLAHNLQEQEIEHHLATNVQRNRLVQYDMQMAKQLQDEEDRKARARVQERHQDRERQDCEIAQEIQVKLVIEAEQRRRQEEDDEDIARILQQKELQEEKRKKKPPSDPLRHGPYEEGYYPEGRDNPHGNPRLPASEHAVPRRARSGERQPGQPRRGPPLGSEGLDLDIWEDPVESKKGRDGQRRNREGRDKKRGVREKPLRPPLGADDDYGDSRGRDCRERKPASQERARGPPSPFLDGEAGNRGRREQRPRSQERTPRLPAFILDLESGGADLEHGKKRAKHVGRQLEKSPRPHARNTDSEGRRPDHMYSSSQSPNPKSRRVPREDWQSPRDSRDPRLSDLELSHRRGPRKDVLTEYEGTRSSSSSRLEEDQDENLRCRQNAGTKSKALKEAIAHKPRQAAQDQELYDAQIARKLQEEELLASHVDRRAAQVAQDEEIARLLMAEEKESYKKAREREKSSLEKKWQDQDWRHETHELVRPRSREGHEPQRPRTDKPMRPQPPATEDLEHFTSQPTLAPQLSKMEPSHKGYHYKQ